MNRPPLQFIADNDEVGNDPVAGRQGRSRASMVGFGRQLPLPFGGETPGKSIVLVPTERLHGAKFRELIAEHRPQTVLDLRQLIRFDFPGTSREDVFANIYNARAHYVKDCVAWRSLTARDLVGSDRPISARMFHELIERDTRSALVLVPRAEDANLLAAHLNRLFCARSPGAWQIQQIA